MYDILFYDSFPSTRIKKPNISYRKQNKSKNNNDIHKNNAVTHLIDGSKENVEEQFLSNYYTPESKKMEE